MRWEAHTNFTQVGIGTCFTILATPQVSGQAPDVLTAGVDLWIMSHLGGATKSKVLTANVRQAVIEMPGGQQWTMTPATSEDVFSNQMRIDMYSQDWVVRR